MKKNISNFSAFLFILFFLIGCSSVIGTDNTEETKMETSFEQKYEYSYVNGVYSLNKLIEKTTRSVTRVSGEVENSNSIDSTGLPNKELGEYNNFEIINIDDNEVVLLNKIYSSKDGYNTKTIWKFNCEITKGTLASYNRGETIEAKSINNTDYDNATEALTKGIIVKNFERVDPNQTSIKINTSDHVFLISKNMIHESSNSSLLASIKLLKE
jgi:hypothetical protein